MSKEGEADSNEGVVMKDDDDDDGKEEHVG